MAAIRQKIETIIKAPRPQPFAVLNAGLRLLAKGYGAVTALRSALYRKRWLTSTRLDCAVVSVGNITVGGTGKTPMTLYLAELIKKLGYRVAILSRGYKGTCEKNGGLVTDGQGVLMTAASAGDEPFLMAQQLNGVPIMVGRNRADMGRRALRDFAPDVILLDDGYQHLRLERDLNLLLLDHQWPVGNGHVLPRGPLRESLGALNRADAVVWTRADAGNGTSLDGVARQLRDTPQFRACHHSVLLKTITGRCSFKSSENGCAAGDTVDLHGVNIFAFAGLAANDRFFHALTAKGARIVGHEAFADHHVYSQADLTRLVHRIRQCRADVCVTTDKDFVRLSDPVDWPVDLLVLGVRLSLGNQADEFCRFIAGHLQKIIANRSQAKTAGDKHR